MNIPIIIVALVLICSGIFLRQIKFSDQKPNLPQPIIPTVISSSPMSTLEPTITKIILPTITISPKLQILPTNTPIKSTSTTLDIDKFIYPNANINHKTTTELTLTSTDSETKITDWYESEIKKIGFNINTFIKTKNNDQILNRLSGSKNQKQLNVEITKNPGDSNVGIKVSLTSY